MKSYRKRIECELVVCVKSDGEVCLQPELIIPYIDPKIVKGLENCLYDWELNMNDGGYIWHMETY